MNKFGLSGQRSNIGSGHSGVGPLSEARKPTKSQLAVKRAAEIKDINATQKDRDEFRARNLFGSTSNRRAGSGITKAKDNKST